MLNITEARKVPIDSSNKDYFTVIIETNNPSFAFISKCLLTSYKLEGLCSEVSREEENVSTGFLLRNPLKLYRCLMDNDCLIQISKENTVEQVISELKPEMDKEIAKSKLNKTPKDTGKPATEEEKRKIIDSYDWYKRSKDKSWTD